MFFNSSFIVSISYLFLSRILSRKCINEFFMPESGNPSPLSHPQKSPHARYARVGRFSIFVFTASPFRHKLLMINALRVKASPAKPSHKVHRFLHRNLLCTN